MKLTANVAFIDGIYGGLEGEDCHNEYLVEDINIDSLPNIGDELDLGTLYSFMGTWDEIPYYVKGIRHTFWAQEDYPKNGKSIDHQYCTIYVSKEPPGLIKTKFLFLDDQEQLNAEINLDVFLEIRPFTGEELYFDENDRNRVLELLKNSDNHTDWKKKFESENELDWNCLISKVFTKINDRTLYLILK